MSRTLVRNFDASLGTKRITSVSPPTLPPYIPPKGGEERRGGEAQIQNVAETAKYVKPSVAGTTAPGLWTCTALAGPVRLVTATYTDEVMRRVMRKGLPEVMREVMHGPPCLWDGLDLPTPRNRQAGPYIRRCWCTATPRTSPRPSPLVGEMGEGFGGVPM